MNKDDFVFAALSVSDGKWYLFAVRHLVRSINQGPYDTREEAESAIVISAHRVRQGWAV
jgi:hypothetical protein